MDNHCLYKVVFKEEDIVKPLQGEFSRNEYFNYPERFESIFHNYLPYLQALANCVYWKDINYMKKFI